MPSVPRPPYRRRALAALVVGPALVAGALVPTTASASTDAAARRARRRPARRDGPRRAAGRRPAPRARASGPTAPTGALRTPGPTASANLTSAPVSVIDVVYVDDDVAWTTAAKDAFEAAVRLWERTVESAVPIVVEATATSFDDPSVLGGAGPYDFRRDDRGTPALRGRRLRAGGAGERPPPHGHAARRARHRGAVQPVPGRALLRHGRQPAAGPHRLQDRRAARGRPRPRPGRARRRSTAAAARRSGTAARTPTAAARSCRTTCRPTAARRARAGSAGRASRTCRTAAPSCATRSPAAPCTGAGSRRARAAGGTVPLYAPAQWLSGSSYGHLDERTYGGEDPNGLMTPFLEPGESLSSPGRSRWACSPTSATRSRRCAARGTPRSRRSASWTAARARRSAPARCWTCRSPARTASRRPRPPSS